MTTWGTFNRMRQPPTRDLRNPGAPVERSREAGIEGFFGELHEAGADVVLRRTVKAVEDLFRFVSDSDAVGHSPRSRLNVYNYTLGYTACGRT